MTEETSEAYVIPVAWSSVDHGVQVVARVVGVWKQSRDRKERKKQQYGQTCAFEHVIQHVLVEGRGSSYLQGLA